MSGWCTNENQQPTLGVAIGAIRVVDESRMVPGVRAVDADIGIKGICVLSSRIIPEESSRKNQGENPTKIES